MTNGPQEEQPVTVSATTKQTGDPRARWAWVEPTVWTERMLTALEAGVKGSKWFSLIDKVHAPDNLQAAFAQVKANGGRAGVDHQSVAEWEARREEHLQALERALREDTYRPQAIQRVWIPKPGGREKRPLGIPTVRDRVAQTALLNVLEPIFERGFAETRFGFRPGRGGKDALRQVATRLREGYTYVVDADIQSYFDSISHQKLMERIRTRVSDGRVLALLEAYLRQGVLEGLKRWEPEQGTPQGAVISPLLANIYLDPLDHEMARQGVCMIRYADDFVLLCQTREEAEAALRLVQDWMTENGLTLHPDKTRLVDMKEAGGFDFLGYHFEKGTRWPRRRSLAKLKDANRSKTRRTRGDRLATVIEDVNRTLKGWLEYFKHSNRWTFPRLDQWIRMRLRSLLRKRIGLKGRGRGADHQRWRNSFFAEHGLFSLTAAHAAACQSSRR